VVENKNITRLVLTNCSRLETICASGNLLKTIELPHSAPNLKFVYLQNNNFDVQNLSCFSRFHQLMYLYIGTNNKNRINQGIYNRLHGSLEYLQNLEELKELDINATDVNQG